MVQSLYQIIEIITTKGLSIPNFQIYTLFLSSPDANLVLVKLPNFAQSIFAPGIDYISPTI